MATHNQVRMVGYLISNPVIKGEPDSQQCIMKMQTMRREINGDPDPKFEEVIIYYDDKPLMDKLKNLAPYDVVDIKGVVQIIPANKKSRCPYCGEVNVKRNGCVVFVRPISLIKINSLRTCAEEDKQIPGEILKKLYQEVSNQVLLMGTVVSEPEMISTSNGPCCRYKLAINRKYYIRTQGDMKADYPWVYSYGMQAERDYKYLKENAVIMVDGAMHYRKVDAKRECENCGREYLFTDYVTDFVPYSVEYLSGFLTDEDIEAAETLEREKQRLMRSARL